MYAVTSMPFVSRTRATLRSAEFGFFGVVVYTRVHTPRFCGADFNAGAPVLLCCRRRPCRTSWLKVGTMNPRKLFENGRNYADARGLRARHRDKVKLRRVPRRPANLGSRMFLCQAAFPPGAGDAGPGGECCKAFVQ